MKSKDGEEKGKKKINRWQKDEHSSASSQCFSFPSGPCKRRTLRCVILTNCTWRHWCITIALHVLPFKPKQKQNWDFGFHSSICICWLWGDKESQMDKFLRHQRYSRTHNFWTFDEMFYSPLLFGCIETLGSSKPSSPFFLKQKKNEVLLPFKHLTACTNLKSACCREEKKNLKPASALRLAGVKAGCQTFAALCHSD